MSTQGGSQHAQKASATQRGASCSTSRVRHASLDYGTPRYMGSQTVLTASRPRPLVTPHHGPVALRAWHHFGASQAFGGCAWSDLTRARIAVNQRKPTASEIAHVT